MSLLDLSNTKAPTVHKTLRQKCHDYEGAYAYFQTRVAEMEKAENFSYVKQDKSGDWCVRITLHSMPLYWKVEDAIPASTIEIKDPSGNVIETRTKQIGHTAYVVGSYAEGCDLLKALAKSEDATFKGILSNAAEALKQVDDVELPHINEKAEADFNASKWVATFGEWEAKDSEGKTGMVYSKEKTNKMNQYKQLARRTLGYERAKVVVSMR
jgi:hypothetical protein